VSQPNPVTKAIRFGMLYGMDPRKVSVTGGWFEKDVMTFKAGDRVLVRSSSKRASRRARGPVLGTVVETPKSSNPVCYAVRIDSNKEVRLYEVRCLSPASIIDEIGRL
jgi:hypothetical protein